MIVFRVLEITSGKIIYKGMQNGSKAGNFIHTT